VNPQEDLANFVVARPLFYEERNRSKSTVYR